MLVFVVFSQDRLLYATLDSDDAHGYSDSLTQSDIEEVLAEWGNDDPTDDDIAEAEFQAGFDGGCYKVASVLLDGHKRYDDIELDEDFFVPAYEITDLLDSDSDSEHFDWDSFEKANQEDLEDE